MVKSIPFFGDGQSHCTFYAVLIGISSGWLLYTLSGKLLHNFSQSSSLVKLPEFFVWGAPKLNAGIVIMSILFTFLLVSISLAAITAVKQVVPAPEKDEKQTLNRGIWVGGISHFLASLFSTIGIVSLPASSGFIQLTGQKRVRPFLIASLVLSGMTLIPSIVNFLSLLPSPIASAALLSTFVQMI